MEFFDSYHTCRLILYNTSSPSSGIVTISTARWYDKPAPYLVRVIINYKVNKSANNEIATNSEHIVGQT